MRGKIGPSHPPTQGRSVIFLINDGPGRGSNAKAIPPLLARCHVLKKRLLVSHWLNCKFETIQFVIYRSVIVFIAYFEHYKLFVYV